MTIAEQLRAEGKAEGIEQSKAEGIEQGKAEGEILGKQQDLTNFPDKKFGPINDAVKRKIAGCREIRKLERAIVRVLDAGSRDKILEELE